MWWEIWTWTTLLLGLSVRRAPSRLAYNKKCNEAAAAVLTSVLITHPHSHSDLLHRCRLPSSPIMPVIGISVGNSVGIDVGLKSDEHTHR